MAVVVAAVAAAVVAAAEPHRRPWRRRLVGTIGRRRPSCRRRLVDLPAVADLGVAVGFGWAEEVGRRAAEEAGVGLPDRRAPACAAASGAWHHRRAWGLLGTGPWPWRIAGCPWELLMRVNDAIDGGKWKMKHSCENKFME